MKLWDALKALYVSSKPFRSFVYAGVGFLAAVLPLAANLPLGSFWSATVASVVPFIVARINAWLVAHAEAKAAKA